jgi:hypothetical protein
MGAKWGGCGVCPYAEYPKLFNGFGIMVYTESDRLNLILIPKYTYIPYFTLSSNRILTIFSEITDRTKKIYVQGNDTDVTKIYLIHFFII